MGYRDMDDLPENVREAFLSHGITSLALPSEYERFSESELMRVYAFYNAMYRINKLADIKRNMVKIASFDSKNIDSEFYNIIEDAIKEIERYSS